MPVSKAAAALGTDGWKMLEAMLAANLLSFWALSGAGVMMHRNHDAPISVSTMPRHIHDLAQQEGDVIAGWSDMLLQYLQGSIDKPFAC